MINSDPNASAFNIHGASVTNNILTSYYGVLRVLVLNKQEFHQKGRKILSPLAALTSHQEIGNGPDPE